MILLIGVGWSLLAAFDLWLLLVRPDAAWDTKIAVVLGLIGVYTFAFGILSASGVLDWMPSLGRDLTSPNPAVMLAGIFVVLALVSTALSVALAPARTRESAERRGGLTLFLVQTPILLAGVLVVAVFATAYVVLIAPLAWIAYVVASAPLDSIVGSGSDVEIASSGSAIRIKRLVDEHLVVLRNALVAIPSVVSSLLLSAPGFF
ncbi:MAG: hypothetical protein ACXVZL_10935 [Gaiellaceae bacterium]